MIMDYDDPVKGKEFTATDETAGTLSNENARIGVEVGVMAQHIDRDADCHGAELINTKLKLDGLYAWDHINTVCFELDDRDVDDECSKIFAFVFCCPLTWSFWTCFGFYFASNFDTAEIQTKSMRSFNYPSYCVCYEPRKGSLVRHYCCNGCCGTHGPNTYGRGNGAPGTGLHGAAMFGFYSYAKQQLVFGDDINGLTRKGVAGVQSLIGVPSEATALHIACMNSHENIIALLVVQGANLTIKDPIGNTALYYACKNELLKSVFLMVEYGANIYDDTNEHPIDVITHAGIRAKLKEIQGSKIAHGESVFDSIALGRLAEVKSRMAVDPSFHPNTRRVEGCDGEVGSTALSLATKSCKKDIALMFLTILKETHSFLAEGDEVHGRLLMRWAVEEGDVTSVEFLSGMGVDLFRPYNEMTGDTYLHLAVSKGRFQVIMALLDHLADIEIENKNRVKALEMFPSVQVKAAFYQIAFAKSILVGNSYQFWFHLIRVENVANLADLVFSYTQKYPELARAQDIHGRYAEHVATSENKDAIQRAYLWFGRYRVMDFRPEHTSKTCFVYRAWDEKDLDVAGAPKRVALKLMRIKEQWRRELDIRAIDFGPNSVVEVVKVFPASDEAVNAPEEVTIDIQISSNNAMTKDQAEQLFCLVMPLADRNMFVALKQERWAGKDFVEVRHNFHQIVQAVGQLHQKGVLHADLKTLNLVRNASWILIDMDASCFIGVDYTGFKSSSAIMPPEAIFADEDRVTICVKSRSNLPLIGRDAADVLLLADPSFDVWSLGCILYHMCSEDGKPLFDGGQDDNLSSSAFENDNLWVLAEWSSLTKAQKLIKVRSPIFANLISMMLHKDPHKRPSVERILAHPALTGRRVARMVGEVPEFDVFLSYRVACDSNHVKIMYDLLNSKGLRVWWDKECLKPGEPWEEGFMEGLAKSKAFVCVLSKEAINSALPRGSNFANLVDSSPVDNVLLEYNLALEFREAGLLDKIFPLMVGEKDVSTGIYDNFFACGAKPNAPEIAVCSVEDKLCHHMDLQGLGSPCIPNRTIASTLRDILACQGAFIEGAGDAAFEIAASSIALMVTEGSNPQMPPLHRQTSMSSEVRRLTSILAVKEEEVRRCHVDINDLRSRLEI